MVECKKAQPKEVMLPQQIAKGRAATRGTYGELVVLNPGATAAAAAPTIGSAATTATLATAATFRYAPYVIPTPLGATVAMAAPNHHPGSPSLHTLAHHHHHPQFSLPPNTIYALLPASAATCKTRAFAAAAAAAQHPAHLTYSMADLAGVPTLDAKHLYPIPVGL